MHDPRPTSASAPGQPGHPDLYAIVYVSTAAREASLNELMHLLDAARRRNEDEGITGLLLYADQRFMQYLEGPASGLSRVYDIIRSHPLHYGLIDLVRQPIAQRQFADWSMAFHSVGAFGRSAPAEQDALLARLLAEPSHDPYGARELLSRFWLTGRAAVTSALLHHNQARAQRQSHLDRDTGTFD